MVTNHRAVLFAHINMIEQLFFELIRVAIGTQDTLSRPPSKGEWAELYAIAKKQSLVGICFAGLQKLYNSVNQAPRTQNPQPNSTQNQEPITQNLDEVQYLTWMGMAAKIQQRNEVVNRQCVDLQNRLSTDGLCSSILKGQGVGALYNVNLNAKANLAMLRQSGDIDVYVAGGMEKVLGYCTEKFGEVEWDYINAHAPFYDETEVELHWRAQAMTNLCANKRLQRWLEKSETQEMMLGGKAMLANGQVLVVPTAEFNAFYILLHCYHHMFESGLGLRQLMDWYFVLKSRNNASTGSAQATNPNVNLVALFEQFGMKKFAEGVLWLLWHVFECENPDSFLVTPNSSFLTPNSKEGKFLLYEVMQNGNFGHHDERVKKVGSGKMSELWRNVQHNWHLASHYPSEFLWQPVWLAYHFSWKRLIKNKI